MASLTTSQLHQNSKAELEQRTEVAIARRFIKLAAVRSLTTLSTSEIYRRIAAGTFPSQITLGPKSVAWVEAEVLAWCDSLVAQRGEAA